MFVTAQAFAVQIYLEKNTRLINNTVEVHGWSTHKIKRKFLLNYVCPFRATVQLWAPNNKAPMETGPHQYLNISFLCE